MDPAPDWRVAQMGPHRLTDRRFGTERLTSLAWLGQNPHSPAQGPKCEAKSPRAFGNERLPVTISDRTSEVLQRPTEPRHHETARTAGAWRPSIRDEFYLVALVVFEIRRVAVSTASERVLIGIHELPAMLFGAIDQPIQGSAWSGVEGQVVEAGSPTIMGTVDQRWRLLEHDVGRSQLIAHAVIPELKLLVAKRAQQPLPSWVGCAEVGYPQLDVMQQAHVRVRTDHRMNATGRAASDRKAILK